MVVVKFLCARKSPCCAYNLPTQARSICSARSCLQSGGLFPSKNSAQSEHIKEVNEASGGEISLCAKALAVHTGPHRRSICSARSCLQPAAFSSKNSAGNFPAAGVCR